MGFGILRPSEKLIQPAGIGYTTWGDYKVELQLQGLGQKLHMGYYQSKRKAQRAYDVARFYTGNEDGEFYFEDTPFLLSLVCRPIASFETVSRGEIVFQNFQEDLRYIAREVIRKDYGGYGISMFPHVDTMPTCYSEPDFDAENKDIYSLLASASGETLIQVNYFRLAIAN